MGLLTPAKFHCLPMAPRSRGVLKKTTNCNDFGHQSGMHHGKTTTSVAPTHALRALPTTSLPYGRLAGTYGDYQQYYHGWQTSLFRYERFTCAYGHVTKALSFTSTAATAAATPAATITATAATAATLATAEATATTAIVATAAAAATDDFSFLRFSRSI